MLDKDTLEKYDTRKIYQIYDKWPQIAKESFETSYESVNFENIQDIIFAGMGGSGALGDIFSSILSNTKIHVNVIKGFLLPKTTTSNTLVIITSVSGNTVETLTVLESAKKLGCKIIAFSDGGEMEKYCKTNNIFYHKISMVHSQRASFPKFLYGMLVALLPLLPITKEEIYDSISEMENLQNKISSLNLTDKNPSLNLARWLTGIPVIYYPWGLQAAAIRFKNSLNENSKTHAISEDVIESCHNEIVSWETKTDAKPILVIGEDDYIKTKERWEILKNYFHQNNIDFREIKSVKGNILSKLINLIYLLDYSSIYLAILSKTDPSPIPSIDFIKKNL